MSSFVADRQRTARILLAALFFVTGFTPALHGQGFGKIVGAVTDPQGLGVASAQVVVTEAVNGPGAATWDVGMFRSFIFRERLTLQLRGEYFNLLNRANFNNPTATISAGGFGSITGAGDPRIGQVALKVLF